MSIRKATVIRIAFSLLILAIFSVFSVAMVYVVAGYQKNNYEKLRKAQVSAAAAVIDPEDVMALSGDVSDIEKPEFRRVIEQLVRIKNSDTDLDYVYVMRPRGLEMVFVADAENPSSPEYTPPGEKNEAAAYEELNVFQGEDPPVVLVEGPIHNKWGEWVNALAPIVDSTDRPVAVLGTDVEAGKALKSVYNTKVYGMTLVFGLIAILALVLSQWVLWRYQAQKAIHLKGKVRKSVDELNEELIKANRMKLEFIQLSSHELRSPMNAIAIAINTIGHQLKGQLTEDQEKLIEIAMRGSARLVDLVDNLLDITRLEAGNFMLKPVKINLKEVIENTIAIHKPQVSNKGIAISTKLPEEEIEAYVDMQAIMRVLENLLSNAIKFTDAGEISVELEADDENIRVTVKDTGIGIPEEFEGDIFEKFKTVEQGKDHRTGAGLGLAFTRSLVENQGGRIWYESKSGGGSLFSFEIPRYQKGSS
ncbi:MAG: HAMP domain-containing histidine kinase [Actinobacteria bacterium]|nr:HAMP domain-containing histidine kinase [Actinomycetota bacterium]